MMDHIPWCTPKLHLGPHFIVLIYAFSEVLENQKSLITAEMMIHSCNSL